MSGHMGHVLSCGKGRHAKHLRGLDTQMCPDTQTGPEANLWWVYVSLMQGLSRGSSLASLTSRS